MVTVRYITYNLLTALKQSFADKDISFAQVAFWVKLAVNDIRGKKYEKDKDFVIGGGSWVSFTGVPVTIQQTGDNNIFPDFKFIDLPAGVFDLEHERGIDYIYYIPPVEMKVPIKKVWFEKITMRELEMIQDNLEKPRWNRPYFIRVSNRLYLAGIEGVPVDVVNMSILATEKPSLDDTVLDSEVLLNDEEIMQVESAVLQLGRWMLLIPHERVEDGMDGQEASKNKQYPQVQQEQQQ